ncbi:hypothetical protein L3Y34_003830 [Caenorhabditis briggsae]|uniref:G-protein coupled receptors family 1 profile domain-containing protein n=1 Tax=Caenorhabditis briggsae TaxID=6238 RepID=A0AAE9D4Q5_CAEBR|nr:hypothetical protein L3Y34_003830 [Caenorhabditis briggsae]
MEPPSWPLYIFYGIEIPSLPLYLMVLICLLQLRCYSKTYKSTFYIILLQHCIADIIIMIFYTATWGLRTKPAIRDFLFEYQEYYIAAALYNSIYYTLYIRCTGIVFLSAHRYLVISAPTSRITSIIQDAATWKIVLVYWAAPTIISLVVLKETKIKYDNVTTLEYVADKEILSDPRAYYYCAAQIANIIYFLFFGAMEPLLWPLHAYYCVSSFSLPLYILVLICLMRLRCCSKMYQTAFYTILLQHCIADIFTMIVYISSWGFRTLPGIKNLYFLYKDYYIPAWTYNSVYYTLYIRCSGIVFLSLHRYLVISAPHSFLTTVAQEASTWKIILAYWTVPTLVSIVVLKDTNITYDSLEIMELRNTLMALIIVALTCFICTASYMAMWAILRRHSASHSKSLQRELHLAFQVLALLCAFFVMFLYYLLQNYFSQTQNSGPVYTMRALYPISNGILSYINPYCVLFLNREFCREFMRTLKCEGVRVMEVKVSTVTTAPIIHRNSRA